MEDATRNLNLSRQEQSEFALMQEENRKKMIQDKIRYLEGMGYRVVLNNTKSNQNRDNDMIRILEANGYKVTRAKAKVTQ